MPDDIDSLLRSVEPLHPQPGKDALNDKIARGIAQLERGEGIPGELARERLQQRKAQWLREHRHG